MLRNILIPLIISIVISSCATNDALTREFVAHPEYSSAPSNKSIITGSVDLFKGNYGWYTLKQISTGKTQIVSATNRSDTLTWKSSDGYGRTYLLELEPGKYEITDWTYFIPALGGEKKLTPTSMTPIELNLEPGKALYLGSFNFKTTYGKNMFGITIPVGVQISVTDEKERDFENLKIKYPSLLVQKLETRLIDYSL